MSPKKSSSFPLIAYTATIVVTLFTVLSLFMGNFPINSQRTEPKPLLQTGTSMQDQNTTSSGIDQQDSLPGQSGSSEVLSEQLAVNKTVIIDNVPFVPQAPYGNWSDPVYQEGCEEASMLMGVYWARGETLTNALADKEMRKIADFETQEIGTFHDTSVPDTATIMRKYFSFDNYRVVEDIGKNDIVRSLANGNIVLVPAYGRDLHNKNYTPPGPIPHMLVITGYDPVRKEFVTNDPGTKYGKGFRYDEDVLFNAIWTYPTNAGNPIPPGPGEKRKKSMIEIRKQ